MIGITNQRANIRYFNYMLLGAVLFGNMENFQNYVVGKTLVLTFLSILGICLFWYSYIKLPKWSMFSKKYGFILPFFIFVGFVTVLRLNPDCEFSLYRRMMMSSYVWPYVMPLLLLLKIDRSYIKYCLYWILVQIFLDFIFLFFNFPIIVETSGMILGAFNGIFVGRFSLSARMVAPIIAFCFVMNKFKIKWQVIIVFAVIISIICSMLGGRRSSTALMLVPLFLIVASYLKNKKHFLLLLLLTAFCIIYGQSVVNSILGNFSVLADRLTEDTRSGTEVDFYNDMNWFDWIFGRGVDGTYRSMEVALTDRLNRYLIETGYLNLILHGGLLFLLPYVYFLTKAIYRGFFKSKNPFIRSFAIYAAVNLFFLYPGGTPCLDLRYTVLFVLINLCINNSKYIHPDDDFDISCKIIGRK